jgi:NADH-quinone oxidoreductase subunit H
MMIQLCWTLCAMVPGIYLATWIDAKLGADLQARVGPSRTGAAGWLQPLADFLNLWRKRRSAGPSNDGGRLWWLQSLPLFGVLAITPVTALPPVIDTRMGVVLIVMLGLSFSWLGVLLSWRSGIVESRFSSIRQFALACAGIPPAMLALLQAGFLLGGLSWSGIDDQQGWAPWSWLVFRDPFSFFSALIFTLSGQLLFSSPPFEQGAGSARWIAAAMPGETGIRLIWIKFGQRVARLSWVLISVRVFLGGSAIPELVKSALSESPNALFLLGVFVSFAKTMVIVALLSILGRTLPSVRADQAHDFAWRVLSPLALLSLVLSRLFPWGLG